MAARNDQAVVVRLSEYSETSQIVALFTRDAGQVRLIGKGLRRSTAKRFAAGLDLLEFGEVSFVPAREGAGLGTLTEWTQRDVFAGLRRELSRLYGGLYAAELISGLTAEHDPHPALFEALLATLRALAADAPPLASVVDIQMAVLTEIGLWPSFEQCVGCGRVRSRGSAGYFSSAAGGVVCRACEKRIGARMRIRGTVLDAALDRRRLLSEDGAEVPPAPAPQVQVELFALFDDLLGRAAGRPFQSVAFLRSSFE